MGAVLHCLFHLAVVLFLGGMFFILFPAYLLSFLCHVLLELLLLPYRFTYFLEYKDVLQRTLQLIGAGIAILGILGSLLHL